MSDKDNGTGYDLPIKRKEEDFLVVGVSHLNFGKSLGKLRIY